MRVLYGVAGALALLAWLLAWRSKRLEERHHQRQLQLREDRLRLALWGSGDEFWDWDMQAGMMYRLGAEPLRGGHREESAAIERLAQFRGASGRPGTRRAGVGAACRRRDRPLRIRTPPAATRAATGYGSFRAARSSSATRTASRCASAARRATSRELRAAERDRRIAAEVIRSMSEAVTRDRPRLPFRVGQRAFTRMTGYREEEVHRPDAALLNSRQHAPEIYRADARGAYSTRPLARRDVAAPQGRRGIPVLDRSERGARRSRASARTSSA